MTEDQITRCRELRSAKIPWKVIAREVGVNINTAKYHVVHKHNPATIAARHRAWAKWAPKRRSCHQKPRHD